MARIRSIKPEFWTSENIGKLSRDARLLFIGLWNLADDVGRVRGALPYLSGALFSYDDDATPAAVGAWLSELVGSGMVRAYTVDGSSYLDIPKWLKHQRIDHPTASKIPAYTEAFANIPEPIAKVSRTIREPFVPDLGRGVGVGVGVGVGRGMDIILSDESDEGSDDDGFDEFWQSYGKKEGKKSAASAWKRLSRANRQAAIDGIPALIAARPEAQYRPHPQKYLNQSLWENEYAVGATPASSGPPDHWIASETLSAEGMAEALRLTILRRSAPNSPYLPGQEP